jgi:hypothetical protein
VWFADTASGTLFEIAKTGSWTQTVDMILDKKISEFAEQQLGARKGRPNEGPEFCLLLLMVLWSPHDTKKVSYMRLERV